MPDCPVTGFDCLTCDDGCQIEADGCAAIVQNNARPRTAPSIVCPHCHQRSWNPGDIEHEFCIRCGYHARPHSPGGPD